MSNRRDLQKAKWWPRAKAYAVPTAPLNPLVEDGAALLERAVLDKGHEADLFERVVLDDAMRQMRTWTPSELIEILEDAATILVTLRDAS